MPKLWGRQNQLEVLSVGASPNTMAFGDSTQVLFVDVTVQIRCLAFGPIDAVV